MGVVQTEIMLEDGEDGNFYISVHLQVTHGLQAVVYEDHVLVVHQDRRGSEGRDLPRLRVRLSSQLGR